MPKATSAPTPIPAKYEDALAELENLVARLEGGQMPLDELLSAYQRGAALLGACRDQLKAVEQQVQVLENGALKPLADRT
jgi:exodeoxyribonuclease VII small subunit